MLCCVYSVITIFIKRYTNLTIKNILENRFFTKKANKQFIELKSLFDFHIENIVCQIDRKHI